MHEKMANMLKALAPNQGNVPTIFTRPAIVPRFLFAVWGQIITGEPLGQTSRDDPMGGV